MKNLAKFFLPLLLLSISFNACIEEDFDNPPTGGTDPNLTVTTTIAELKDMHTRGQITDITDALVIKGTVVADDFSGNLYKSFVIQDETGGITVLVDVVESYVYYPVGREVYIKLSALALDDYNGLIQIGVHNTVTGTLDDIVNVADHLIKSVVRDVPAPKTVVINNLSYDDVGLLVQIEGVEFTEPGAPFADAAGENALNRTLADCNANETIVRTSGFASFANAPLPSGNGTLIGILSIFDSDGQLEQSDYQILVRELTDVAAMSADRCDGSTGGPCGGPVPTVSGVDEGFENGANNDPVAVNGWTNVAVKGTRTWQFKEFDGNVYCQGTAFNDAASEMETWLVTPLIELTEPQVLTFETAQAFYTHNGLSVWLSTDFECDPTLATWQPLSAILANSSTPDNTWVPSGDIDLAALVGQKFAIGFKYVGSGTGGQTGSFRVDNVKLGEGGVIGPNGPCVVDISSDEVSSLDEDFSSGVNNEAIALSGWTNVATKGTRNWLAKEFSGNIYVQATAFNDTEPETECWLVTPLIDVTSPLTLTFETAKAFWFHNGLTVWIQTADDCQQLTGATIAGSSDVDHEFVPSGDIDLSPYIGQKIAIAFKYEGNDGAGLTTSYRIDNLVVQ